MNDEAGKPISYMVLRPGTRVFDSEGTLVGEVAKVLAVEAEDVFDGIVIAVSGSTRFIDADQIGSIHEYRVDLEIDADQVSRQPAHEAGGGAYDAEFGDRDVGWRAE